MALDKKLNEQAQPTNEEQMARRQSSPRPSMLQGVKDLLAKKKLNPQGQDVNGATNGMVALSQPIGTKEINNATQILQKYKAGKANLENRIVANEQWYKLRHWGTLKDRNKNEIEPTSAWLFNALENKHADAMDNFPAPNVLPREEGDKAEAEMLSSIIPVILDQNDFESVYDDVWTYKLKSGTGVYGIFWDNSKMNGLGDIAIKKVDILNLFWESGVSDIQDSQNVFHVSLVDNNALLAMYPDKVQGHIGGKTISIAQYIYDDSIDTTDKSCVVDWYYKKRGADGRVLLHYVKYVNDVVLFATENDEVFASTGLYDHGLYPFVFDALFKVEGTPAGFGYIDVGKSCQEYIDRGNQAIMTNMLANTKPRYFIRNDGSVNEEEFADMTKDFVHVDGALNQDSVVAVNGKMLNAIYVNVINNKVDELKEVCGNRDINTGGSTSGVTAASAIAAMQEAGSKLSRDANKASYRAYRKIILMVIELIRQHYDLPRKFRILGQNGMAKFVSYSNENIRPQAQGNDFGIDMGMRMPLFDIEITAQKASPYSKMSQNELALQFLQLGFFNPNMADQALACLDMMDFDRKSFVQDKISQNAGMLQQLMMLAGMIDGQNGTQLQMAIAQQYGLPMPQNAEPSAPQEMTKGNSNLGGKTETAESKVTEDARKRTAESTSPV